MRLLCHAASGQDVPLSVLREALPGGTPPRVRGTYRPLPPALALTAAAAARGPAIAATTRGLAAVVAPGARRQ